MNRMSWGCKLWFCLLITCAWAYENTWDTFTFTQEWPQTACIMGKQEGKKCKIPDNISYFTIHGLWPTDKSRTGPMNCKGPKFDMSLIKNLTKELLAAWPNIYSNTRLDDFWVHEWTTHGTCALSVNATGTQYLYFRKTLDLMQKYNVSRLLEKASIRPNKKTYSASKILSVLKRGLGIKPDMQCYRQHKDSLLAEIRICMNKSFKLKDCNSNLYFKPRVYRKDGTSVCSGNIIYPEIKRN